MAGQGGAGRGMAGHGGAWRGMAGRRSSDVEVCRGAPRRWSAAGFLLEIQSLGVPVEPGIVRGMLLDRILSEAISEGAGVVVLETGAPAMLVSPVSAVPSGAPLGGDELFEAVSSLLDEAQQVDLAVGSVVQTTRAAAGTVWTFVIEPRVDGLWVRCARDDMGSPNDLPSIDLDPGVGGTPGHYDPLPSPPTIEYGDDPFAPAVGFRDGVTSGDDVELGLELEAPLGASAAASPSGATPSAGSSGSRFGRAAEPPAVVDRGFQTDFTDDDDAPLSAPPPYAGTPPVPDAPPFAAATPSAAAQGGGAAPLFAPPPPYGAPPAFGAAPPFGVAPPFGAAPPIGAAGFAPPSSASAPHVPPPPAVGGAPFFPSPPRTGVPSPAASPVGTSIGSATTSATKDAPPPSRDAFEDDEVSFSDVSSGASELPPVDVGPTAPPSAPTVQLPAASSTAAALPVAASVPVQAPDRPGAAPVAAAATLTAPRPSVRDAEPRATPPTEAVVRSVAPTWTTVKSAEAPGSLVDELALGSVCFVLGGGAVAFLGTSGVLVYVEGDDPKHAAEDTQGRAPGSWIVLAVDDPSPWLGWILRRLEEGHRVLVDTHARSPEGARRTLLGLNSGPRAEPWLAAHAECAIREEGGIWQLQRRSDAP